MSQRLLPHDVPSGSTLLPAEKVAGKFTRIAERIIHERITDCPSGRKMPTVKGIAGPYRVFFFSFDCDEPKHVHVQRERMECKFWLDPISPASNDGFSRHELNRIRALLRDHLERILEAWDEHCGE